MLNSICGVNPEISGLALDRPDKELPPVREERLLSVELLLKSELKEPPKGDEEPLFPFSLFDNSEDRSGLAICAISRRKKSVLTGEDEDAVC
jgi:hypothetical protein